MTLSRETIDAALVAINHQRGERRRSRLLALALGTPGGRRDAALLARRIAELDAAHAELSGELEAVKAAEREAEAAYAHRHRECGPDCCVTGDECPPIERESV